MALGGVRISETLLVLPLRRLSSLLIAFFVVACGSTGGGGGADSAGGSGGPIGTISSIAIRWTVAPDIAGYRIHWGRRSAEYTESLDVGMPTGDTSILTYVLDGLDAPGTYFFAMTSYDQEGRSSTFSNEIAVTVD
jgi:hypothetical protein